jgi:hypothetical protein
VNEGSSTTRRRSWRSRRRSLVRRKLAVLTLATTLAFGAVATFAAMAILGQSDLFDPDHPVMGFATVIVPSPTGGAPVPRSFFGLSTEYWTLPIYDRHLSLFERVVALLHVNGNGPLVLRIGGDSADHTFWDPNGRALPSWAFSLTPKWLDVADTLVHQLGVRLIFDLNLITDSPATAAHWAREVRATIPRRSLIGFEIGNEPDIYSRSVWRAITAGRMIGDRSLPHQLTPADYVADFRAYAAVLRRAAPGVALLGPAVAEPRIHEDWIAALVASHPPALRIVTAHRYPYSGCVPRRSSAYPTITRMLSERASAGTAASLIPSVEAARGAGLPLRLTELNSVTCGGLRGVSDSFATALWAPDTLFELLRDGVSGANIHLRVHPINAPFTFDSSGLVARPLLYGLILFSRTLGPHARVLPLELHVRADLNLKAWAVSTSGGILHILLLDKGRHPVRVRLHLPSRLPASLQRLIAPSVRAHQGVTLGGQHLGPDGRWLGTPSHLTVRPTRRGYTVTLPRYSAALLTLRGSPGATPNT